MSLPRDVAAGQQVLIDGFEAVRAIQSRKRHHTHRLKCFWTKEIKRTSSTGACVLKDAPEGRPQPLFNPSQGYYKNTTRIAFATGGKPQSIAGAELENNVAFSSKIISFIVAATLTSLRPFNRHGSR